MPLTWATWIVGTTAILAVGLACIRAGYGSVVRFYVLAGTLPLAIYFAGSVFPSIASIAPTVMSVLAMLAAGTCILAVVAVKRDRDAVIGRPGEREKVAAAAVLSGASSVIE